MSIDSLLCLINILTNIVSKKTIARNFLGSQFPPLPLGKTVLPHSLRLGFHLDHIYVMVSKHLVNQWQCRLFAEREGLILYENQTKLTTSRASWICWIFVANNCYRFYPHFLPCNKMTKSPGSPYSFRYKPPKSDQNAFYFTWRHLPVS